jgi:predicted nucleotidyltransferase
VRDSTVNKRDVADPRCYYTAQAEAVASVAQSAGIDLVVLFGSAARGRLKPQSDVDVAVHFVGDRPGFEEEARVAGELHAIFRPPRDLDLVVLNQASPMLLMEVAGDGIPLYASSADTWPLFWIYARRRFEDTEKFRRRHWEALKERVRK